MARLPGFTAYIADGQLRIPPNVSGPKLLIVGTTTNTAVPLLEPVRIADGYLGVAALRHADGSSSELSIALEEVLLAGAQNVEILCMEYASGELDAYTANERWDSLVSAYEVLRAHPVDFVHPIGAYIDESSLSATDPDGNARDNFGKQLGDALYLMTKEGNTAYGVIGTMSINRVARKETWTSAPANMSGEYFATPIRDHVTEWVYHLTGSASGDDHSTEDLTTEGFLAGSIETAPGSLSGSYDFWARSSTGSVETDQFGGSVDGAMFYSVVAGLCRISGVETTNLASQYGSQDVYRNTNGAASFAGFLTTLDPQIGATNKVAPGLEPIRHFNLTQVQSVLDARFVTFFNRPRGYVVLKGITGAHNASDYTRSDFVMTSTTRITLAVQDIVVRTCEPYIGEPANVPNQNAMEAAIESSLRAFQKEGALRRFNFHVEATPDMMVLGEAAVILTIVPAFELTNITVQIALAKV